MSKSLNAVWAASERNSCEVRERTAFSPSIRTCRVLPASRERNARICLLDAWCAECGGSCVWEGKLHNDRDFCLSHMLLYIHPRLVLGTE